MANSTSIPSLLADLPSSVSPIGDFGADYLPWLIVGERDRTAKEIELAKLSSIRH